MIKDITEKLYEAAGIENLNDDKAVLEFDPTDYDDIKITKSPGEEGVLVVSYLAYDEPPENYWDSSDGLGKLTIFSSQDARDEMIAKEESEGRAALVVDHYSHSSEHYSVQGTRDYPNRRWDVAPRGVFVPCDDAQNAYKRSMKDAKSAADPGAAQKKAMDALIEDSNRVLQEYSDYCNGEVYGVVRETWKLSADGAPEMLESDACWGYIGHDYAMTVLNESLSSNTSYESPAP